MGGMGGVGRGGSGGRTQHGGCGMIEALISAGVVIPVAKAITIPVAIVASTVRTPARTGFDFRHWIDAFMLSILSVVEPLLIIVGNK